MSSKKRILSGMRPTGPLHLGNLHGALNNWVGMQDEYDCFFFIADWHALTSDYENPGAITDYVNEMMIDWLSAGLDPEKSTLFVQSLVPEHAELFLFLSMITPVPWLERNPTYKDQIVQLSNKDLSTFGFRLSGSPGRGHHYVQSGRGSRRRRSGPSCGNHTGDRQEVQSFLWKSMPGAGISCNGNV